MTAAAEAGGGQQGTPRLAGGGSSGKAYDLNEMHLAKMMTVLGRPPLEVCPGPGRRPKAAMYALGDTSVNPWGVDLSQSCMDCVHHVRMERVPVGLIQGLLEATIYFSHRSHDHTSPCSCCR